MLEILLIDDDEKLAQLLKEYCEPYAMRVTAEHLPSTGLQRLRSQAFSAVILDVMLPETDGFTVCKTIRSESDIPIIMLTARGDVTDRVVGLEIGADDYLPKPFDPRELVARLNTIINRKQPASDINQSKLLRFEQMTIDQARREVSVNNKPITLTTMEYQLLLFLANSPGEDHSRDDILNHLKGTETELFSRSVDILVSRLRAKLKPATPIKPFTVLAMHLLGRPNEKPVNPAKILTCGKTAGSVRFDKHSNYGTDIWRARQRPVFTMAAGY